MKQGGYQTEQGTIVFTLQGNQIEDAENDNLVLVAASDDKGNIQMEIENKTIEFSYSIKDSGKIELSSQLEEAVNYRIGATWSKDDGKAKLYVDGDLASEGNIED